MLGIKIGFDIGTTTVTAYVDGKGIVVSEPAVVSYNYETGKISAIGQKAYNMLGRSPDSLVVIKPMRDSAIYDFQAMQNMLTYYIQKICGIKIFKPNLVMSVPSTVTPLEKRSLLDLAASSGAAKACLIDEPLAAALGAELDINRPKGVMVVDIGSGTTDVAVVTMGRVSVSRSIKVAGNRFNEDIMNYLRRERNLIIGETTAEDLKKELGCTKILQEEVAVRAVGKDYITNLPKMIEVTSTDIFLCIREHLEEIVEAIRSIFEKTPPEQNADITETGITLTGGSAMLRGIDEYIEKRTKIRTNVAKDPSHCVANGIGKAIKNTEILTRSGYSFLTQQDIKGYEE